MPVTPVIAPELFDALFDYAKEIEKTKDESTRQPIDFCDNFFAQFFQNRIGQKIEGIGNEEKQLAVKLRVDLAEKTPRENDLILLISWFERYCDVRYDIFSEQYAGGNGGSNDAGTGASSTIHEYLEVLLQRISAWAQAEAIAGIAQKSDLALTSLRNALQSIKK